MAILSSIGEAAYAWRLDSDELAWTPNAADVLGAAPEAIASGRAYAAHVEAAPGQSRAELLAEPGQIDRGGGIPYQLQYGFKRDDGVAWLEDSGRWFAGPDGRPVRAHGIVRRIDERHARDLELARLAKFDALTGELNRPALTNVLSSTLEHAVRARLLRVSRRLDRSSRTAERNLRHRNSGRSDRAGRQAPARTHARQGSSRPLFRRQIRRGADELHAG
jgi:hypothetical protein